MLISLNWLKQYVDINENIEELEEALTMIGQEVEAIDVKGKYLDNVYVGHIVEYGKHPDSDKLSLVKVNIGQEEVLQIVCGAPNHKEGDRVAVAVVGACLPGDFKIKKAKVRGVESCGMLCSEKELAIGEDHEGIMILPEDAPIGTLLKDYLEINDVVFELEITPNRPDCLSHIGIAREVAAYYKRKVKYPKVLVNTVNEETSKVVSVDIQAKEKSKRYVAKIIRNIKVEESPKWLQDRLKSIGLKPINNIVDATNFVMMEYNHPMHAFDLNKISGNKITVREANKDEKIITLDGVERTLEEGDLVIADGGKAIAIAGVMGGQNTAIDNGTTDILLEVAHFDPRSIRKTSKRLGLSSDSSYRFERGVDLEDADVIVNRISALIKEIAGGDILSGLSEKYHNKYQKREISLSLDKLNKFIGKNLTLEIVGEILSSLQIELISNYNGVLTVTPPSYRDDLVRPADLYEEVIRMYGFANIEAKMPNESIKAGTVYPETEIVDRYKRKLVSLGLQEVINYSFIPKNALEKINMNVENTIDVKNPIVEDMTTMRATLVYSLLTNVRDNFNRSVFDLSIFEVGRTYTKKEDSKLANENVKVAIAIAGKKDKELWNVRPESFDFYDLKAYVEAFLESIGIKKFQLHRTENKTFHPGRAVDVKVGKDLLGTFGEIHPDVAENMDIKKFRVNMAEFDAETLEKYSSEKIKYEGIVKYPAVERDLAIVLDKKVLVGNMLNDIKKISNIVEKVELFDIYEGDRIESNKKSVAINILMRSKLGTLNEDDVNKTIEAILQTIHKKYHGEIRQ